MRAAIALDDWKRPIFERHLTQAGYAFEQGERLTPDTSLLIVTTKNAEALAVVVQAACDEAAGAHAGPAH